MNFCNAKNHASNCECGFGGAKASSTLKKMQAETTDLFALPLVPRHYTKGSERCPFCDAPVFFHPLANHGGAYFDEPGAPWSKHSCTDKASESYRGPFGPSNEDWPQLTQISAKAASDRVLRLSGKLSNQWFVVFVHLSAFRSISEPSTYLGESIIQAHPSRDGRFALALLTPDSEHMLLIGYPTVADANSEQA
jgi:hypothetical protein